MNRSRPDPRVDRATTAGSKRPQRLVVAIAVAAVVVAACGAPPPLPPSATATVAASVPASHSAGPSPAAAGTAGSGPVTYHSSDQRPGTAPATGPRPAVSSFTTGIQATEPSIAILPDGRIAYQGWDRPATGEVGTSHVFVGGPREPWRDISPSPAPATHDPYLNSDPATGRIFSSSLKLPGELDPDAFCAVVTFTDDDGANWISAPPICADDLDRPRLITSKPITTRLDGYPNLVHLCYFLGETDGQSCARSVDGGRTFQPSGSIPPDGCDSGSAGALFGHLATDAKGTLYLGRMSCGRPMIAISTDEGQTWVDHAMGPRGWNGYADVAVAVDDDGVIYGLWVSNDRLPYLAISRDAGSTWTDPIYVAPPGVTEANLPVMEVGIGGHLAMGALVSLDAPAGIKPSLAAQCVASPCREARGYENVTWHASMTITTDALAADPLFISAVLNDPARPIVRGTCGPGRCKADADFIDVAIDAAGQPWLAYVACPDGDCPQWQGTAQPGWASAEGMLGTIANVPLR